MSSTRISLIGREINDSEFWLVKGSVTRIGNEIQTCRSSTKIYWSEIFVQLVKRCLGSQMKELDCAMINTSGDQVVFPSGLGVSWRLDSLKSPATSRIFYIGGSEKELEDYAVMPLNFGQPSCHESVVYIKVCFPVSPEISSVCKLPQLYAIFLIFCGDFRENKVKNSLSPLRILTKTLKSKMLTKLDILCWKAILKVVPDKIFTFSIYRMM